MNTIRRESVTVNSGNVNFIPHWDHTLKKPRKASSKKPATPTVFWSKLHHLMESQGVKPAAVADLLGIEKNKFTRWKNGSSPKIDDVMTLARHFGFRVDYLADDRLALPTKENLEIDMRLSKMKTKEALDRLRGEGAVDSDVDDPA